MAKTADSREASAEVLARRVLLVEDDPDDAEFVRALLDDGVHEVTTVADLASALELVESGDFDVALLDLNLPDSGPDDTLVRFLPAASGLATVVVTVIDAGPYGPKALELGAQDYLSKGQFDERALHRSLEYAYIRHRMRRESRERADALASEIERLRALTAKQETPREPLHSRDPATFEDLSATFAAGVEASGTPGRGAPWPHDVAARLADVEAGPRDVIELYVHALERRDRGEAETARFTEEGRLRALEIMGHLTRIYRDREP